jgi:hypothetical protein
MLNTFIAADAVSLRLVAVQRPAHTSKLTVVPATLCCRGAVARGRVVMTWPSHDCFTPFFIYKSSPASSPKPAVSSLSHLRPTTHPSSPHLLPYYGRSANGLATSLRHHTPKTRIRHASRTKVHHSPRQSNTYQKSKARSIRPYQCLGFHPVSFIPPSLLIARLL